MFTNQPKADVYDQITNAIIAAIEAGTEKYEMPWHCLNNPVNAISRKLYRGVNVLMLWAAAQTLGSAANEWATYRQWQDAGAQVRKGERSTTVVFWKFLDRSEEQQDESEAQENRHHCLARAYNVFNAAQVDGYTPAAPPQLSDAMRLENADRFFAQLPAVVKHGGDRAFYSPTGDFIQMPEFSQFKSPEGYVSVLAHELSHWSGAPNRLNRDLSGRFGDERYGAEELIAELSASFLCADLQIRSEPRRDHAPYLGSWLRVLRTDKRALFTAASKAQEAVSYLHNLASRSRERAS